MTQVFRSIREWREFRRTEIRGRSLGFVPTMGALHEGHLSLVERSRRENDLTLASIFVNPTQFNDPRDLEKYPRTFETDLAMLERSRADFLLYPEYQELYPDGYRYKLSENQLSRELCGAHRPGHFDGVLTVVMKLLQIAGATKAYFGEKDFQQYLLIRGMAEAFFLETKIVPCPIIRETDGLAMSSRNMRLNAAERAKAAEFARLLGTSRDAETTRASLTAAGFEVDYVEERFGRRFGAVRIGEVRLIDNVEI